MSRCHLFPPPGYVKNAPVETELSSKKEKRRHKDKTKKRKKHSGTNGDLTIKDIKQSGQPNELLYVGSQTLPSVSVYHGTSKGLQTASIVDEACSSFDLDIEPERKQRLRSGEESPSRSLHSAERLQGDFSRHQPILRSSYYKDSCQRFKRVNPAKEGLPSSCLSTSNKRLILDSPTSLSNGIPTVHSCKRPEHADNSEFLNGVLSTKRKRLQADNSISLNNDDNFPTNCVFSSDCKNFNALQTGRCRPEVLMQATTDGTSVPANYAKNSSISKGRLSIDFRRSEKALRADQSRSELGTNGSFSKIGQRENPERRDVPHSPLVDGCAFQNHPFKPEIQLKYVKASNCGKMQMNSYSSGKHLNGMLTSNCEKSCQPEESSLMSSLRCSSMNDSLTNRLNEVFSSPSAASLLEEPERRVPNAANSSPNAFLNGRDVLLQWNCTERELSIHNATATSAGMHIKSCRQDMKMPDIKGNTDRICNRHNVLANSCGHIDQRLQTDSLESRVSSNGVILANQDITTSRAANDNNSEAHSMTTHSSAAALHFEDRVMEEKLSNLSIPHPEQVWVTTLENEDWLVSCKQSQQSKEGEKGKETEMQQVWAEAVLLQVVNLTALPFVVLN